MIINLKLLDSGKQETIEYNNCFAVNEVPFKDTDLLFTDDFCINYIVEKAGGDYCVNGDYKTKIKLSCDKCLVEYDYEINDKFTFVLMEEQDEPLDDEENIIIIESADSKVDITESIRENILLSLPFLNKCAENCKGLCPDCGEDLNKKDCGCASEKINPAFNNILQNFKD